MKQKTFKRIALIALLLLTSMSAAAQYVVCTGNHVRLRTGPSTSYPYLIWTNTGKTVHINKGQTLTYLGDAGGFFRVAFDGKSVYISKQYSYLSYGGNNNYSYNNSRSSGTYVVVDGRGVRLRYGPSLNAGIYAQPRKGTRLPYLGTVGNWYKVRYNGQVLYISRDYSYLQ